MTTREYLQTPETVLPRELAFGTLRVADSPVAQHQSVVRDLLLALAPYVRERGLGEVLPAPMDVILDYDAALVGQPDLLFVSEERRDDRQSACTKRRTWSSKCFRRTRGSGRWTSKWAGSRATACASAGWSPSRRARSAFSPSPWRG